MTIIWLVVWLLKGTPPVNADGSNSWFVGFLVCLTIDLLIALRTR